NLALLRRLDDRRHSRASVDAVIEEVGLGEGADAAVAGYSAGMRQRLGLAAALLRSPALLIVDEPTNSLDPASATDVRTLIRRLAQKGVTVLLSSHDMAEVEQLCATMTVIDHGGVVFAGSADELRRRAPADVHVLTTSDDHRAMLVASGRA